jgi:protein TonB
MFDLITGQARHLPRHQGVPIVVSTTAQVLVGALVLAVPYLYVTEQLPEIPSMMAFVAAPPPPPPPPPPPAPAPKTAAKPETPPIKPGQLRAPVEAPPAVAPEPVATSGSEEGVYGGVEGGVPGGVYGGVVGGIPDVVPPPPPPPPPAQSRGPVRIGGQLKAPELVQRVDAEYPGIALAAQMEGLVILEAVVGEAGNVEEARVLRSAGFAGVLDRAALAAVRQWRYSPLLLNGRPTRFVLTVTMSFSLADAR